MENKKEDGEKTFTLTESQLLKIVRDYARIAVENYSKELRKHLEDLATGKNPAMLEHISAMLDNERAAGYSQALADARISLNRKIVKRNEEGFIEEIVETTPRRPFL
jgi:hypothetical protein